MPSTVPHALEILTHVIHPTAYEVGAIITPGSHDDKELSPDPKTEKCQTGP